MDLLGEPGQQRVLEDALLGVGQQQLLVAAGDRDALRERADRERALLIGDADDDDAVGAVPLGMVVLAGRGQLGLQILQRPGQPGGGYLQ